MVIWYFEALLELSNKPENLSRIRLNQQGSNEGAIFVPTGIPTI
jgi:hypothetical protein